MFQVYGFQSSKLQLSEHTLVPVSLDKQGSKFNISTHGTQKVHVEE